MNDITQTMTIDQLFKTGQFRWSQISVMNWGSFSGIHHAPISPNGTLLTGETGAGKTTLIDAGYTLLRNPQLKGGYNIAASGEDKQDRSPITYIRGAYGESHDGLGTKLDYTRPNAVVSAIANTYQAEDDSIMTLAILMWIPSSSTSQRDMNRLYIAARRCLSLEEIKEAFVKGDKHSFKKRLLSDGNIRLFDRFKDYWATASDWLQIENNNAPALLTRALGLKKVDNLTQLLRDMVLEPSTVKDTAAKCIASFHDIIAIHDQMVDARDRRDALERLPKLKLATDETKQLLAHLEQQSSNLSAYIAQQAHRLYLQIAGQLNVELENLELDLNKHLEKIQRQEQEVDERYATFLKHGGNRIEVLKNKLEEADTKQQAIVLKSSQYQSLAMNIGWDKTLDKAIFNQNLTRLAKQLA